MRHEIIEHAACRAAEFLAGFGSPRRGSDRETARGISVAQRCLDNSRHRHRHSGVRCANTPRGLRVRAATRSCAWTSYLSNRLTSIDIPAFAQDQFPTLRMRRNASSSGEGANDFRLREVARQALLTRVHEMFLEGRRRHDAGVIIPLPGVIALGDGPSRLRDGPSRLRARAQSRDR